MSMNDSDIIGAQGKNYYSILTSGKNYTFS